MPGGVARPFKARLQSPRGYGTLALRITVLGKSPSWQDAGGACSGYLIETDETKVLLDCGNGVFGKLRERIDYTELDGVIISHLHADHFLDLVPYSYALIYAPEAAARPGPHLGGDRRTRPVRGWSPRPAPAETFRRVVGAWGNDDLIESAFRIEEYSPGDNVEIGDIRATFHPVPHFVETFAVRISVRRQRRSRLQRRHPSRRRDRRRRPGRRPAVHRGDAAAPGAHRASADTSLPRRPASTRARRAPSGS